MSIKKWIRDERTRLGLSQKELAEKVGTNQGYVSLWEGGKREASPDEVKRLKEIFGKGPEGADAAPEEPKDARDRG